jgi:tetratricopeptide (TPR) repeat protein
VYRDQGEYDQSRAKYEEALVLYRSARAKNGIVNATRLLGDLFRRQKKFDDARKRYEEALQLSHEFDDKAAEATCLMALGDLLFELKE